MPDLSFPKGGSVNNAIDPEACAVSYTSFDATVFWVRHYGKGALMAKTHIESAFRLLPVHPHSFPLLGCRWLGAFYVDRCKPMGCSISCAFFETFSSFLELVVQHVVGVNSVIHYLNDFLCVYSPSSKLCGILLATVQDLAERFGTPLVADKTEGPTSVIKFLGIEIDSRAMECHLADDKLDGLKEEVRLASGKHKIQLRELQSLLGKLNFACHIIPMGRVFCCRLNAAATAGVYFAQTFHSAY